MHLILECPSVLAGLQDVAITAWAFSHYGKDQRDERLATRVFGVLAKRAWEAIGQGDCPAQAACNLLWAMAQVGATFDVVSTP